MVNSWGAQGNGGHSEGQEGGVAVPVRSTLRGVPLWLLSLASFNVLEVMADPRDANKVLLHIVKGQFLTCGLPDLPDPLPQLLLGLHAEGSSGAVDMDQAWFLPCNHPAQVQAHRGHSK